MRLARLPQSSGSAIPGGGPCCRCGPGRRARRAAGARPARSGAYAAASWFALPVSTDCATLAHRTGSRVVPPLPKRRRRWGRRLHSTLLHRPIVAAVARVVGAGMLLRNCAGAALADHPAQRACKGPGKGAGGGGGVKNPLKAAECVSAHVAQVPIEEARTCAPALFSPSSRAIGGRRRLIKRPQNLACLALVYGHPLDLAMPGFRIVVVGEQHLVA